MRKTALLILLVLAFPVKAIDTFIIGDILVEGLQRVAPGAVFVALPVRVGDEMNDQVSASSIQALFATGLFDDVRFYRDGDTLIVSVVERPTISEVTFDGNRKLKDEIIENALRTAGLAAGDVYNPELVDSFTDELKRAYFEVGHFSVEIFTSISPLDRNRVELNFTIGEGKIALIKEIQLVGNEKLTDKEILKAMKLSTKKTLGFLNRNNRYNREQLRADLESISSLYLNQGFIEFSLLSSRTFLSESHKEIMIVITMTEGEQFKFGELSISSSDEVLPQEELEQLVVEPDEELYSFEEVSETRNTISEAFADLGYGRAQVDALPTIHDEDRTIDVNYVVKPGKLTYIRTITFRGNYSTTDEVLRREMRVNEGGLYTSKEIQQSRNRLNRLGIFAQVDVELLAVPGTEDQVDLVVTVQERLTGSLLFGVGYSESEKASFNFSVSQSNLFGTGKRISLGVGYGEIEKSLELDYTNPYYTQDGVARGINFGYRERDTSESDTSLIYTADFITAGVDYLLPVSEEGAVGIALNATQQDLNLDSTYEDSTDYRVADYIGKNGRETESGNVILSYRKDTRNRAFFATEGSDLYLGLTGSAGDESYFGLRASYAHYFPMTEKMTFRLSSQLDVGSDELPFYRNYYMSGGAELRGFNSGRMGAQQLCRNSEEPERGDIKGSPANLGSAVNGEMRDTETDKLYAKQYPDTSDENGEERWYYPCNSSRSLGGNARMVNRAELFFPFFGDDETDDKRISIFLDHGYTFLRAKGTYAKASKELGTREEVSFGNMRSSFGIGFEWLSPIGPFGVHYAVPVKKQSGDETDSFQITLGTFFE